MLTLTIHPELIVYQVAETISRSPSTKLRTNGVELISFSVHAEDLAAFRTLFSNLL
jgi:hypothetical protein